MHPPMDGVLLQKGEDGKLHPIAYGSQLLTKAKKNYQLGKAKFLTLKWAMTDHFKVYLIYQPFVVCTDNNPLTHLFTIPNLNVCRHQWVASLTNFNFTIKYQHGRNNVATDALSWVNKSLSACKVKAILSKTVVGCQDRANLTLLMVR